MPDDFVIVLTTWPNDADPLAFAREMVEERLAACVNVLPEMTSVYRWEGRTEQSAERQLLMKTARSRVDALRDRLHTRHPYEVPEFLVVPIDDGSDAYLTWLRDCLSS